MTECMCKQYGSMLPMDVFFSIKSEDKISVSCPICDETIKFKLPKHIPRKQANRYAGILMRKLKNAKA